MERAADGAAAEGDAAADGKGSGGPSLAEILESSLQVREVGEVWGGVGSVRTTLQAGERLNGHA